MAVRKHLLAELTQKAIRSIPGALEILLRRTDANLTSTANELPKLLLVAEDKPIHCQSSVCDGFTLFENKICLI